MDFIGDIVEKEVAAPLEDDLTQMVQSTEKLKINRKPSRWRQRLQAKKIASISSISNDFEDEAKKLEETKGDGDLTEKEKIHLENLKLLASMSPEQLAKEKEELFESIDPKILNALMRKSVKSDQYLQGGAKEEVKHAEQKDVKKDVKKDVSKASNKKILFDENVKIIDDLNKQYNPAVAYEEEGLPIPTSEQLLKADRMEAQDLFSTVHFPKNPRPENDDDYKLDIDDPDFLEKLHDKYFPDLPKDVDKLKWMEPVASLNDADTVLDPEDLRFDFSGNIVAADPETIQKIPTSSGLYHHSANPQLPGYTLLELSSLCRSRFNSQRCIAIRTTGRILYKLGIHKYDIIADTNEEETDGINTLTNPELKKEFESSLWKQVAKLQIIPILMNSSDEKLTSSLSVRNYAIEALWLFKQGGGDKALESISEQQ